MDKKDGGPSSRVAEARQKVLAIFGHDKNLEGNSGSSERQNFEMPAPGSTYNDSVSANSYNYTDTYNSTDMNSYSNTYSEPVQSRTTSNTYQANTSPNTLKDTAVNQTAINEQWQQYHSAWQNYYQQYYSEYYAKAAQNYLESEKLKNERTATGKVREKRRLRHIAPIIAGATVVLILLFLQYNRLIFTPIMAYVSPNTNSVSTSLDAIDPTTTGTISPEPRLIIPKLNIDVPVAFGINYNDVAAAMEQGVAQFSIPGANAMPGQVGNLVLSGHSSGDIYSNNIYKFIFSGLERLSVGDLIYINYESTRYTYRMTGSQVVEPSDVNALIYPTDRPILTLITCTPLGTSRYRLLITAEQISPDFDANNIPSDNPTEPTDDNLDYSMPSNQPTFVENIWTGIFGS